MERILYQNMFEFIESRSWWNSIHSADAYILIYFHIVLQAVITVIKMDTLPESAQNQSPVENVRDKDI